LKIPCFQTGIFIWSFLSAFNFVYVAPHLRTLYVGLCNFFWFNFLAYLKTSSSGHYQAPIVLLYYKYRRQQEPSTATK
jgi:hypothetical protein